MGVETLNVTAGIGTAPIAVDNVGGTAFVEQVKINLGADGALGDTFQGTLAVSNLNAGTITKVEGGTISVSPLAGVVLNTATAVGTTATALPASVLSGRKSLLVYNSGTVTFYIGGSGVTTATGLPVGTADYSPSLDLGTTILYGIASSTGGTAISMEIS